MLFFPLQPDVKPILNQVKLLNFAIVITADVSPTDSLRSIPVPIGKNLFQIYYFYGIRGKRTLDNKKLK